jgi:hypothetical protein
MALSKRIAANLFARRTQSSLSGLTARSLFEQYGEPFNSFSVANDGLMIVVYDVLKVVWNGLGLVFVAVNRPKQIGHHRPRKGSGTVIGKEFFKEVC